MHDSMRFEYLMLYIYFVHFSNPLGFQQKEMYEYDDNLDMVKYVSSHGDKKASFVSSEKSCNRFQMHC